MGAAGDSDVMNRISGKFLSWLQDKTAPVYVIATANNLDGIITTKLELLRKGCFDEIFKVDLPDAEDRARIFKVCLERHGIKFRNKDKDQLVELVYLACDKKMNGFSGVDIYSVVVDVLCNGDIEEKTFSLDDFKKSINNTPISELMGEHIGNLMKNFKKYHFRDANKEGA